MRQRRAGTRRHFVELQRVTRTKTVNGYIDTWTTYARVWASVEPVAASQTERQVSSTTQTPISHVVETDYRSDTTVKDRVLFSSTRALFVQGMQNLEERGKTMILACEERAA